MNNNKPTACIEKRAFNPGCQTTNPTLWEPKRRRFLFFYGQWFQVTKHYLNKQSEYRVYAMVDDGVYLKLGAKIHTDNKPRKKWYVKALVAAGFTKDEVTAVLVAIRMHGEGG